MPYDANGNLIASAYDVGGSSLQAVYDIAGNAYPFNSPYLTVMTFNVQGWGGVNAKTALIEKIFTDHKPDIVGLQEAATDGGYVPTFFRKTFANTLTKAKLRVFSNLPYSDVSESLYTNITETRGFQRFMIRVNGKDIAVYNTHLEVKDSFQQHCDQIAELIEYLKQEEYFIALGDFNYEGHSTTGSEYPYFVPPLLNEGFNLCNWTQETGFVDTWFGNATPVGYMCPCDNVITSPNIDVLGIVYDQTKIDANTGLSLDHIPVVARLKVN